MKAGLALAALLALWGAMEFHRAQAEAAKQRDPFQIGAQSDRFAGFAQAVPQDAVLGYLTDLDPGAVSSMMLAAQYALAPRLLRQDTSADLVLGNFTRPADFAAMGRRHGLELQRDFGNGVVLYRKAVR